MSHDTILGEFPNETVQKPQKGHGLAHREGRTRSLQIVVEARRARHKSLTLYPIELGRRLRITRIGVISPCMTHGANIRTDRTDLPTGATDHT